MRRWLAILLLALLPLQLSWAAVAAYCAHESAPRSGHVGHHAHEHVAPTAGQGAGDEGGSLPPGLDLDCGHCHASAPALPVPLAQLLLPTLAARPALPPAGSMRTLPQRPPERPQWLRFA